MSNRRHRGEQSASTTEASGELTWHRRYTNIGRLMVYALQDFEERVLEKLHSGGFHDARMSHTRVLREIELEGTRLNVLADRLGVSRQAAGKSVRELEELRFVRVDVDAHDSRGRRVTFMPKGRRLVDVGLEAIAEVEQYYEQQLGKRRYAELQSGLERLVASSRGGDAKP